LPQPINTSPTMIPPPPSRGLSLIHHTGMQWAALRAWAMMWTFTSALPCNGAIHTTFYENILSYTYNKLWYLFSVYASVLQQQYNYNLKFKTIRKLNLLKNLKFHPIRKLNLLNNLKFKPIRKLNLLNNLKFQTNERFVDWV
jgi:hypothetical protein